MVRSYYCNKIEFSFKRFYKSLLLTLSVVVPWIYYCWSFSLHTQWHNCCEAHSYKSVQQSRCVTLQSMNIWKTQLASRLSVMHMTNIKNYSKKLINARLRKCACFSRAVIAIDQFQVEVIFSRPHSVNDLPDMHNNPGTKLKPEKGSMKDFNYFLWWQEASNPNNLYYNYVLASRVSQRSA